MRNYPRTSQEWMDANQERLAQLQHAADRARSAVESTIGRAASKDGSVTVAVDSSGDVVSLQISDAALSHGGAHLAESIVVAMREARQSSAQAIHHALANLQDTRPGADVLEVLGLPIPQQPQSTPEVVEDHWGDRSVLYRA